MAGDALEANGIHFPMAMLCAQERVLRQAVEAVGKPRGGRRGRRGRLVDVEGDDERAAEDGEGRRWRREGEY